MPVIVISIFAEVFERRQVPCGYRQIWRQALCPKAGSHSPHPWGGILRSALLWSLASLPAI